jgi:hypothetical protein
MIYIGGDSFCHYRTDAENHWPAILADRLNLSLEGEGFPGQSWWATRQHFISYANSPKFDQTKIFIFCHTDQNRILTKNRLTDHPGNEEITNVRRMYYKYIHDYEISDWCTEQWYRELNSILKNRLVLHIQCFHSTKSFFPVLEGLKISEPLLDLSLTEINNKLDKFLEDSRHNHFTPDGNRTVADIVLNQFKGQI